MPIPKLAIEILTAALDGFEVQRNRIDEKIAELRRRLDGSAKPAAASPVSSAPRRKRRMSAAARKRIADAQKKRWAEFRKTSQGKTRVTKKARAKKAVAR
jgi:hypothetical protein